ncbi:MAG TPA: sugar transferase [Patescibacteria group bacterium]|nr:sugar transferase [Patescibacteria group bacterium]
MYYRFKQLTLLLGDLLMLYAGLYLAIIIRYLQWPEAGVGDLLYPMTRLFLLAVIILFIVGLYDIAQLKRVRATAQKAALSGAVWLSLGALYFYLDPIPNVTPKTILLLTTITSFTLITLWRYIYKRFISSVIGRTTVVFAGLSPETVELLQLLSNEPQRGYRVIGCIIAPTQTLPPECSLFPCASSLSELIQQNNGQHPGIIVTAPSHANDTVMLGELYQAIFRQVSIVSLADFYEQVLKRVPPFTFSETWFITNLQEQHKKIYDRFRILIDYAIALLMAVFFFITFPLIALLIKFSSRGPIFFRQTRVGRLGQLFVIHKYRTMRALHADGSAEITGPQFASVNDPRVTGVGRILRRTRLDELPQCINILRGDMGIVGPRPERPEFVEEVSKAMPFFTLRHLIKPGLTGWAQIHESYYGTLAENIYKLQFDLYYIKNRSILLDIAILLRTINIVLRMIGR